MIGQAAPAIRTVAPADLKSWFMEVAPILANFSDFMGGRDNCPFQLTSCTQNKNIIPR